MSNKTITLKQCAQLIAAIGNHTTVLVQGEMGIGKSAILKELAMMPKFKDYNFFYMDMTTKDIGDLMMPKARVVDGTDVYSFIPNEEFGLHIKDKPAVIMLDEYGKVRGAVQNACNKFIYERSLGMYEAHPETIVFATTNLTIEGLGDSVPAHVRNRITTVQVAKPTAEEWIHEFAIPNEVHPAIITTAQEYPQMFASFLDFEKPEQNVYISHPGTSRAAVVTGRSMERASNILKSSEGLDHKTIAHALAGTVGEPAAREILAILTLENKLPSWESVISHPADTELPGNAVATCLVVMRAVQRVEKETFPAWMEYCERLSKEAQGLFARSILSSRCPKQQLAATQVDFVQWVHKNHFLFAA